MAKMKYIFLNATDMTLVRLGFGGAILYPDWFLKNRDIKLSQKQTEKMTFFAFANIEAISAFGYPRK